MPETFTVLAEDMPGKDVSVTFAEPTFADRREASRRYPTSSRVGYSMEELLLAMSIKGFNGNDLPPVPRDPIQYLRELSHVNGQYLLSTFLGMFTLDEDQAKSAKEIGTAMKISASPNHSVGSGVLPVSGTSFSFHSPTIGDRMDLDKTYPGADSNCGYSLEEMLFAACIDTIDGTPVTRQREAIQLLDEWTHLDAAYGLAIFINAVTMDKADSNNTLSLGKSLRAKKASPPKSTKATKEKSKLEDTTITA